MKSYDKAAWHIDGGENSVDVVKRFKEIFQFLSEKKLLTEDGLETLNYCMDSSVSLNSSMVNPNGAAFLDSYYDTILDKNLRELRKNLEDAYTEFKKNIV